MQVVVLEDAQQDGRGIRRGMRTVFEREEGLHFRQLSGGCAFCGIAFASPAGVKKKTMKMTRTTMNKIEGVNNETR